MRSDGRPKLSCERLLVTLMTGEDGVATLQRGANVTVAELIQQSTKLGHRQLLVAPDGEGLEAALTVGGGDLVMEPLMHPVPLAEQVDLCPAPTDRAKAGMSRHPSHHLPRPRTA